MIEVFVEPEQFFPQTYEARVAFVDLLDDLKISGLDFDISGLIHERMNYQSEAEMKAFPYWNYEIATTGPLIEIELEAKDFLLSYTDKSIRYVFDDNGNTVLSDEDYILLAAYKDRPDIYESDYKRNPSLENCSHCIECPVF